jgi:hypothetical protein
MSHWLTGKSDSRFEEWWCEREERARERRKQAIFENCKLSVTKEGLEEGSQTDESQILKGGGQMP